MSLFRRGGPHGNTGETRQKKRCGPQLRMFQSSKKGAPSPPVMGELRARCGRQELPDTGSDLQSVLKPTSRGKNQTLHKKPKGYKTREGQ